VNVVDWWLPNLLQWSIADVGTNGKVRFLTTVETTGQTPTDLPLTALYRMACFFVLAHLDEKSLSDAWQSLADIYAWQVDRNALQVQIPEQQRLISKGMREAERVPFALEE
jgi:hypothetical protein